MKGTRSVTMTVHAIRKVDSRFVSVDWNWKFIVCFVQLYPPRTRSRSCTCTGVVSATCRTVCRSNTGNWNWSA
jgi:hypothetical protein